MNFLKIATFSIILFALPNLTWAADKEKDCSCPIVTCGPCQKKVTVGKVVKFCDWGDVNVCRKTVCENVSFYFSCLSKHDKKTVEGEKKQVNLDFLYDDNQPSKPKKKAKKKKAKRGIASIKQKRDSKIKLETEGRVETENESRVILGQEFSNVKAGVVVKSNGALKRNHRGQKGAIKAKQDLYVGDEITNPSKKEQKLKLSYEQGSVELVLAPKSKIIIEDPMSIIGRFQPFVYLVHGGVSFKPNFKEGSFDLLAGQILTRAGQGHFSVIYEMAQEGLKVKVESFEKSISVLKAQDLSGRSIDVAPGTFLSWVSETPGHIFNSDEKQALAGEGFITPVFSMSEARKKEMGLVPEPEKPLFADWTKNKPKKDGRDVASMGESLDLCSAPQAQYQQCAWTCEGNKKGAKECQAQKQGTQCVRRMCNAAGQWGMPTAFASSYRDLCPPTGTRVGDCSP